MSSLIALRTCDPMSSFLSLNPEMADPKNIDLEFKKMCTAQSDFLTNPSEQARVSTFYTYILRFPPLLNTLMFI